MEDQNEYAISSGEYALTDTGTSCIIGPSVEADVIVRNIVSQVEGKVYAYDGWGYIFECPDSESDLPGFSLLFGG